MVLEVGMCFSWMYGEGTDREMNCGKAVVAGLGKVAEAGMGQDRRWNTSISFKMGWRTEVRATELSYCCLSAEVLTWIDCHTDVFRSSKWILFLFCPAVPSPSLILLQAPLLNYNDVSLIVSKDCFSSLSSSSLCSPWPQVENCCTCLIWFKRTILLFISSMLLLKLAARFIRLAISPAHSARVLFSEWMFMKIFHLKFLYKF